MPLFSKEQNYQKTGCCANTPCTAFLAEIYTVDIPKSSAIA
ncbi:hypothetical protein [Nostoc sp. DedQUE09]|nr:hypothetical protein [Nostoc sp. DedQUE09]MDZ7949598.1 hypothetical protein [Nostoc sp. DedQUE09]